ncbi:NUDIX domain-containing protein [Streptomyces sp. NBC_00572]|uniref:NUDIX domain-containing protein n=1 Tax=Streptomyces sp. NBC_00572 TaxID=2903664 RepID=UPI0022553BCC|nr:NUDIX hydrolase [Streptomyces sp. NBC_00572]MCX4986628.1 NUDIX hydrolase [Streptomyces sp. NBC_00572]
MKQRVRAILITPQDTTLVMKRVRPGSDPYWVIVGGGVEETDATREDALLREVREEIAGDAEIIRLLHETENTKGEKSYHSMVVPMRLAATIRLREPGGVGEVVAAAMCTTSRQGGDDSVSPHRRKTQVSGVCGGTP